MLRPRQSIGNSVTYPGCVPNVGGKLRHIGKMALLSRRPRRRHAVQSGHERLVVGEDVEDSALQEEPEVPEGLEHSEQLPVEGGVAGLRGRQLPGEERQGTPTASTPLLESSSNVGGGGIYR